MLTLWLECLHSFTCCLLQCTRHPVGSVHAELGSLGKVYLCTEYGFAMSPASDCHAAVQVGYQAVAAKFFYYALVIFLMILISETLGMLFAGAFRAELTGSIVLQAVYVPLLMFVGFFQVRSYLSDAPMCL